MKIRTHWEHGVKVLDTLLMDEEINGVKWYFAAWHGVDSWIGYAKKEPFEVIGVDIEKSPLLEPGELHFEIGKTPETAIAAVRRSVLT